MNALPILNLARMLRGFALLLPIALASYLLTACDMDHRNLPRNMNLKAFDPHRPDFTCVQEADVVPAASPQAETLFQQGMAATSYELAPEQRDYIKAARFWEQAAELGHWKAALNLAGLYEEGLGVPPDTEQAVLIVEKLMNRGVPSAFDKMGTYHAQGIAVKPDISRAYAFWQLAADKGSAAAQGQIGAKLMGAYDNPSQGFWGNDRVGLKMLKCGYAQGNGHAAFKLGAFIKVDAKGLGETLQYALQALHDGVKFGSPDCASYLSSSFFDTEPLTGGIVDADRGARYSTLGDALRLNPDLRFPNLDKVLPLPPAKLPMWDGQMQSLVNAAKGVLPVAPPQPTPGARRTGRAHIPNGYVLPEHAHPRPPHTELAEILDAMPPHTRGEPVRVNPVPDLKEVSFSGYWLPQLVSAAHDWRREWNARQLPQRYARGEVFEPVERKGMGEFATIAAVHWLYRGEPVPVASTEPPPLVVQGTARLSTLPDRPITCVGALPCPHSGVWLARLASEHPRANVYNRWDRQAYVRRGESFPDPGAMQPRVQAHERTWHWLANANEVDFSGTERIATTPRVSVRNPDSCAQT